MGTPPYREWEHNASLSSINSKNLRHERFVSGGMGSTECRSFFYLFLLKNAKSRKVLVVTFILPMQSMGYNHALYFIRGDQDDGRNFLLVGCHCIVNMLYYYYYCHNIVLVNKLA